VDNVHVPLADLIRDYGGPVLSLARGFARDSDELEDLVQEIWLRIHRQRHRFRGSAPLPWILVVGRHVCLDQLKRDDGRAKAEGRYVKLNPPPEEEHGARAGRDAELDDLAAKQQASAAVRALTELPRRQREAIALRLLEGLSPAETAERMGCRRNTVRSLMRHGLQGLRRRLGDDLVEERV
jgi:RNA polymerase sigma-70 factor (ECF subfamily)